MDDRERVYLKTNDELKKKYRDKLSVLLTGRRSLLPTKLAMEQATHSAISEVRLGLVNIAMNGGYHRSPLIDEERCIYIDLTGGLGNDLLALNQNHRGKYSCSKYIYIEKDKLLYDFFKYNISQSRKYANRIDAINDDCFNAIKNIDYADYDSIIFFVDPARRAGNKPNYSIEDTEPNITEVIKELEKTDKDIILIAKLSPMASIPEVARQVGGIDKAFRVQLEGEVKEHVILKRIGKEGKWDGFIYPFILSNKCIKSEILKVEYIKARYGVISYLEKEPNILTNTESDSEYIFIPHPIFRHSEYREHLIAATGMRQIDGFNHIYIGNNKPLPELGRYFEIKAIMSFGEAKRKLDSDTGYNIIIKNIKLTEAEAKKKLGLKSGIAVSVKDYLLIIKLENKTKVYLLEKYIKNEEEEFEE